MNWKWTVAGVVAMGLGAAGTAQATSYLVTVNLLDLSTSFGGAPGSLGHPIVFQQIVNTGPFTTGSTVQNFTDYTETRSHGGGAADSNPAPFVASLGAAIGLDDAPLTGDFGLSQTVDVYSYETDSSEDYHVSLGRSVDTQIAGVNDHKVINLNLGTTFGGLNDFPITEDAFSGLLLGGGSADLTVYETYGFGIPSYSDYSGTYTAAVLPAPEPAAWALMLAGFGLAGAGLRRRRVPTA